MLKSLAFTAMLLSATSAFAEQRAALVVGNDNYMNLPHLTKGVSDANAVGAAFKDMGYEVTIGTDLTAKAWAETLQKFKTSLAAGSTAVVYIASHALTVDGTNYVVPVDVSETATKGSVADLLSSSINFDGFIDDLGQTAAANIVIIFDSCSNNPFAKATRGLSAVSETHQNVALMFSSAPGRCPFETTGNDDKTPNSPFARILLEELKQPGVSLSKLNSKIRLRMYETGLDQQPWYHESSSTDIILHPAP